MPDGNEKVLDQGILTTIETGYIEQDGDLKYQDEMALCSYFETGDGAQLWGIKDPSNLKLRYNSPLNQEKQLKAVESYQGSEEDLQSSEVQGQGDLYQGPEKLLDKNWNLIQIEDKKELFMSDVFGQVQTAVPLIPGESESHLYDNEIYKEFGFGDFNTYLKNKRAKLQINDREIVRARLEYERDIENEESNGDIEGADEDKYPPIFKNKTIYLNGHTDPPPAAIHRMIILHGGIFVVNPAAIGGISKVDYIVCGQVAAGKKQKWTSAGYRLVKPEWVLESIKARKILNWGQFRVVDIADTVKTHRLNFQPLNDDGKTLTRDYNKKHSPGNASKPVSVNKRKVLTTDPDFIAHYYSKSRLHHLSTWKANLKREFQQRVLEKTELSQQANSTPLPPSNMSHPIILHIDLDCFFASVGLLERPHISPLTAVGVSHGAKHSSVASCNYVARKFGVSNGMSVGRARQLCPGIVLLPYDFNAYEKASRAFYEVVLSLDARLVYPVSVDEVLVDVTNIVDAAVKDEDIDTICTRLGNAIRNQVKCVTGGCEVSIGGSVNILLAKLCLRRAKPRGQFFLFPNDMSSKKLNFQDVIDIEVHAGPVNNEERKIVADEGIKQFLVPLELKSLPGVGPSLVKSLAPLVNVNQLRQASLRHLTQALGVKRALGLYWAARGVDRSNLNLREVSQRQLIHSMKQKAVSVEISWGVRLYSDGDVRVFVENLCKEVIGRLKLEGDNYGGRRIGIKLYKTLYSEKELVRLAIGDDVGEEDLQDSGNEIDEGETPNEGYRKPMGHGPCTYHVKATTVPSATNDLGEIFRICWSNISSFGFRPVQIRGIGVSIGLLQDMAPDQGYGDKAQPSLLQFFLKKGATPKTKVPNSKSRPMATQEVDWEVFEALPASLRTELIEQDIVVNRKVNVQMSRELVSTPRPNEKVVLASDDIDWEAFSQLTSSIKRDIDRERSVVNANYISTPTPRERRRDGQMPPPRLVEGSSPNTDNVDSQVFRELPSFIQREIIDERQRKQHYGRPKPGNTQIPVDFTSTPQVCDIDWSMFDMLPRGVQREVLERYKLSQPPKQLGGIKPHQAVSVAPSQKSREVDASIAFLGPKTVHFHKDITEPGADGQRAVSLALTELEGTGPIDGSLLEYIQQQSIDLDVFKQLPSDIQRDYLAAWRRQRALRPDRLPVNERPFVGRLSLSRENNGERVLFPGICATDLCSQAGVEYRPRVMMLVERWMSGGESPRDRDLDLIEQWLIWCVSGVQGSDWSFAYDIVKWVDWQVSRGGSLRARAILKWCNVLVKWKGLVERGAQEQGVAGVLFECD